MELLEAIKIIRALSHGAHPSTGEVLPADSICKDPQTVKALNRALGALVAAEERARNRPTNAGKYWSRTEDSQVCDEVRQGLDFHQIAKLHNRSVGSIVARLVRLGKISSDPSSTRAA